MNKKLLLGLGSITTTIMPIMAVISCSSESSQQEKVIENAIKAIEKMINERKNTISAKEIKKILEQGEKDVTNIKIPDLDRKNSFGANVTYSIDDTTDKTMKVTIKSKLNESITTKSLTIDGFISEEQYKNNVNIKLGTEIKGLDEVQLTKQDSISIENAMEALKNKKVEEIKKFINFFSETGQNDAVFKKTLTDDQFFIENVRKTLETKQNEFTKKTTILIEFDTYVKIENITSSKWTVKIPFSNWEEVTKSSGTYTQDAYIKEFQEKLGNTGNWTSMSDLLLSSYSPDKVTNELLESWTTGKISTILKTGSYVYDALTNKLEFIDNAKTYEFKRITKVENSENANDGSLEIQLSYENVNNNTDKLVIKIRVWGFAWGKDIVPTTFKENN